MARKYNPPQKKRRHPPVAAAQTRASALPAAVTTTEFSLAGSQAPKSTPAVAAQVIKYETLPRELRRVGVLTAITIIILIILWLILR